MMIGQLSKLSGIGIETIRYYEKEGLLKPKNRKQSGYREYDDQALERLDFIKRAKDLGFSLREIKDLFTFTVKKDAKCSSVKKRAQSRLSDVYEKIEDLNRIKLALEEMISCCNDDAPTSECPILDSFFKKKSATAMAH